MPTAFLNSLLSYLLLFFLIAAVAGVAVFLGVKARKRKDAQEKGQAEEPEQPAAK